MGPVGLAGRDGFDGRDGAPGPQGAAGPTGRDGRDAPIQTAKAVEQWKLDAEKLLLDGVSIRQTGKRIGVSYGRVYRWWKERRGDVENS
jgi:DNA invertase Pin-like site-specific DNA recombinase